MVAIAGGWNYGDIYDALGAALPADAPALIHGDRAISWGDFTARSNRLARALGAAGLTADSKVGFYCRNHPAYMEMLAACFKGRFVHVNVNYRYVDEELYYIFDNSDAEAVLYAREFAPQVEALKARLPKVKCFIEVSDDTDVVLDGALSYEALAQNGDGSPLGIPRSGDDLLFLYTGGTTGMPKGVMWGHDDHWHAGAAGATPATNLVPPESLDAHVANVLAAGGGSRMIPCCPLMHGTGLFTAMGNLAQGAASSPLRGIVLTPRSA